MAKRQTTKKDALTLENLAALAEQMNKTNERVRNRAKKGLIAGFRKMGWDVEADLIDRNGLPSEVHAAPALAPAMHNALHHLGIKVFNNQFVAPKSFFFVWGDRFPDNLDSMGMLRPPLRTDSK
jgi:predicted phage tail protein